MRKYTDKTLPSNPFWVLELAERCAKALPPNHSANFCLYDARAAQQRGDWLAMANWAVRSLDHSIGLLDGRHPFHRSEGL